MILKIFESIGTRILAWIHIVAGFSRLTGRTFYWIFFGSFRHKPVRRATCLRADGFHGREIHCHCFS